MNILPTFTVYLRQVFAYVRFKPNLAMSLTATGFQIDENTKSLLLYAAWKHGVVTRTSLIKLAYLIDYIAVQRLGQQITNFKYIRYNFGPFDKAIYGYLDFFVSGGIFTEESKFDDKVEYITYQVSEDATVGIEDFSDEKKEVIDIVLDDLKGFGPKALTRLAYNTPPMKKIGATLGNKVGMNENLDLNIAPY